MQRCESSMCLDSQPSSSIIMEEQKRFLPKMKAESAKMIPTGSKPEEVPI